jgi:hypothetical protein
MTDAELVEAHDEVAGTASGGAAPPVGVGYYLSEIARRDADRQTRTMVRLTWVIALLTLVNVAAVIYSVVK